MSSQPYVNNVIRLADVFNIVQPVHRRNYYDHCAQKLMHAGSKCEGLRKYIELEQINDPVLKNYVQHALDVLADAYSHAKGEYDKIKKVCSNGG